MKKKTKIILGICAILIVLFTGVLGVAGNYFYTLAIDANSDKSAVFGSGGGDPDAQKTVDMAFENLQKHGMADVYHTDKDGYRLHAYELRNKNKPWVIIVHGYMSEARNMSEVANSFYDQGYQILMPDLRSHGLSEGDAIGMGAWDSEDIVEWIDTIVKQEPDAKIILYGVSMGASTVMMTTGKELPSNVAVAIEDCGYTSAWDEFSYQLDALFGLPSFPALDAANLITKLRAGYNLKDADALEAVRRSKTPMLFIHGDQDDFVPSSMVESLYEAASSEKALYIVKGAGHGEARNVDPTRYWKEVYGFINRYIE